MTGTLHKDLFTFMMISCRILLRMRDISDECCRENQNTFYVEKLSPAVVPFMR